MVGHEGGRWDVGTEGSVVYLERISDDDKQLFADSLSPDEARALGGLLTKYADKAAESEDSDESEDKAKDSDKRDSDGDDEKDSDKNEESEKDDDSDEDDEDSDKDEESGKKTEKADR
jgi:hypothetical protein